MFCKNSFEHRESNIDKFVPNASVHEVRSSLLRVQIICGSQCFFIEKQNNSLLDTKTTVLTAPSETVFPFLPLECQINGDF